MSPRASIAALLLALLGGCSETRRSLGEDCLKDDDCLSGICSQLQCAAAPRLLDRSILPPAADANVPPPTDAGDAGADAGEAAPPADARSDG